MDEKAHEEIAFWSGLIETLRADEIDEACERLSKRFNLNRLDTMRAVVELKDATNSI